MKLTISSNVLLVTASLTLLAHAGKECGDFSEDTAFAYYCGYQRDPYVEGNDVAFQADFELCQSLCNRLSHCRGFEHIQFDDNAALCLHFNGGQLGAPTTPGDGDEEFKWNYAIKLKKSTKNSPRLGLR